MALHSIRNLWAFLLGVVLFLAQPAVTQEVQVYSVGGDGSEFQTIPEVLEILPIPLTSDVEIRVEMGDEGIGAPPEFFIDATLYSQEGFGITVVGASRVYPAPPPAPAEITYYIGSQVEYRDRPDGSNETIYKHGSLARQIETSAGLDAREYPITDHIGSTFTLVGETGIKVGPAFEYFPYGKQSVGAGAATAAVTETFTGKELDVLDESATSDGAGLYFFGGRYYDADLGIWISPDPAGQYHSAYSYSYQPLNVVDPSGEFGIMGMFGSVAQDIAATWFESKITGQPMQIEWGAMAVGAGLGFAGFGVAKGALRLAKLKKAYDAKKRADKLANAKNAVNLGGDVAETAAKSGSKGASGTLRTANGKTYHGNSTGSSASGGHPRAPMNTKTEQALADVKNPSRTHGHCCEIDAINKALNAGEDVRGAKMGPVILNESGRTIPPCSTCRDVLKTLEVE